MPGDLLGLAGPSDFNLDVVEVGEGVVLDGADLGLVPTGAGAGVVWTCHHAVSLRQVPDPSEADQLRAALVRRTDALADLDVARWRPEVADRADGPAPARRLRRFPTSMAPRAVRLAALFDSGCRTIVELALER